MTINQALNEVAQKLQKNKIPTPHFPPKADLREAEILLSHIIKKPREYILAHPEKKLTKSQVTRYALCVMRRLKGEPIAYITGHKEFYGLDFYVNKNVLIPRPETELMVDEALKLETPRPRTPGCVPLPRASAQRGRQNLKHATFIDVGTGSGCIIIALAKILKNNTQYPISNIRYLATDISKPALSIARKNAKLHQVDKQIKFFRGNLMEPVIQNPKYLKCLNNPNYPIIITANLPYLTPAQIKNSPTIQHEPKLALDAGADGLKYYRKLFKQIKHLYFLPNLSARGGSAFGGSSGSRGFSLAGRLKPPKPALKRGRIIMLCEIDPSQTKKIKQLIKKELFKAKIQIKKDLRMLNRLVICSINLRQD